MIDPTSAEWNRIHQERRLLQPLSEGCREGRTSLPKVIELVFKSICLSLLCTQAHAFTFTSTFVGGPSDEIPVGIASDMQGNVLITGWTYDSEFDVTDGAYDESFNGGEDVFVSKLTPDLSALLGSTYIGGDEDEEAWDIGVDHDNNIIVCGYTHSTNFPVTPGAYSASHANENLTDAFVSKLSADLGELEASTCLGGSDDDYSFALLIGSANEVVVTGETYSVEFPTTSDAYDRTYNAAPAFVSIFNSSLSALFHSTFLDGMYASWGCGLLFDNDGNVIILGATEAPDFPTTPGAYDRTANGSLDLFLSIMTPDLSSLLHSTFVGGSAMDDSSRLFVEPSGDIVVAASTESGDFPTTPGVYDRSFNDSPDAGVFDIAVFRISADLSTLKTSTYVGGDGSSDRGLGVAVDPSGDIFVAGSSFWSGFPTTPGALDTRFNGWEDAVIFALSGDMSRLLYSTYLGGGEFDEALDLAWAGAAMIVVTGMAGAGFPSTAGAYDTTHGGAPFSDCFVVKIDFIDSGYSNTVTGPGPGPINAPLVKVDDVQWSAYNGGRFGVNVACARLDASGLDRIITDPGPGEMYGPHVRGFDSTGTPIPGISFLAYGTNRFGVNVAGVDIDGDGFDEIITGAGPGVVFGPHVRGWKSDGGPVTVIPGVSFLAYGTHRWGVNEAGADIDDDGYDEVITGAGPGADFGPHVRGWNCDGGPATAMPAVSFLAYGTHRWGVNVAGGDIDGDGIDEIITGPGPGSSFIPHVRGWNYDGSAVTPMNGVSFIAYTWYRWGVVVATGDVDGDGIADILTMPGPDPVAPARALAWNAVGGTVTAIPDFDFIPYYPSMTYGGKIAGGHLTQTGWKEK